MIGAYYETFERTHENASKLGLFGLDPVTGFTNDQHVVQYTEGDSWSGFGQVIWNIRMSGSLLRVAVIRPTRKTAPSATCTCTSSCNSSAGSRRESTWTLTRMTRTSRRKSRSPGTRMTTSPSGARGRTVTRPADIRRRRCSPTPSVQENITFGEEDADGFELGLKSLLFDGSVRLNVTAYDFEFTDLQVSQFRPETTTFVIGNAASASTTGIEFDASWLVNDNLEVYAEFGYNDAKYDDYPDVAGAMPFRPRHEGCIDGFQDLSGETLAGRRTGPVPSGSKRRAPYTAALDGSTVGRRPVHG